MRLGFAVPKGDGAQLHFGQILVFGLALTSLGAGVIHCSASPDHASLPLHAAFFVVVGLAQILWAPLILKRASRALLYLGGAGNLALQGVWLFSRTTGIWFVPGAEEVEPIGFKDSVTVFLEVALVAGVGIWTLLPHLGRELVVARGRVAVGAMVGAVALMMVAAVAAPSHQHHLEGELAADHPHGGEVKGDHHDDQGAVAHPAHGTEGDTSHEEAHALALGPGHALGHTDTHGDTPPAGTVHHRTHAHHEGNPVEGVSHSHDDPSGSVEDGHQHDASSAEEGTHDHGQDHQGDHHGDQDHDHDHEGGGPLGDLMTIIGEAGKRLGL